MPTIGDNIKSMAALVADVKKTYHLSETSVLRIVDMNFALAQAAQIPTMGGDEDMPFDPATLAGLGDGDIPDALFPANPTDIEAVEERDDDTLATVEPPQELKN